MAEFRLLGPLEAVEDGKSLLLGSGRQRALLALLLLHRNEALSVDRIVDALWGAAPPPTASKIVQVYVSGLRKALGDSRLATQRPGYRLRVEPGELDVDRVEELVREAREAEPKRAAQLLRSALALWRGQPLADLAYESFAQLEIARLEELRLTVLEERIEVELALGRQADLVHELEALVAQHPLRERLRGQLMLALYRCGRQAEALEAYQAARRALTDELGLEPARQLQELERAILTQDPALDAPRAVPISRRRRPSLALAVGGVLVLAAAIAALVVQTSGGGKKAGLAAVEPNGVGVIDPTTNRLVDQVPVGSQPSKVSIGEGAVWVLNADDRTISRIDPRSHSVRTFSAGAPILDIATGAGKLWVAHGPSGTVARVDPQTTVVERTIRLPRGSFGPSVEANGVAVSRGSIWVSGGPAHPQESVVWRLDATTNHVEEQRLLQDGGLAIAVGQGSVWIRGDRGVVQLDEQTGAYEGEVDIPENAYVIEDNSTPVAIGKSGVWATSMADGTVWRIDPGTAKAIGTVPFHGRPVGVAVGDGSVWITDSDAGRVIRYDPVHQRVIRSIHVGGQPSGVAVGDGAVWVAVD